jgi:hypothetical protein
MKPATYRQIEARYGFTIDEIRPEHYPRSWKKFTLKASYADGRRLMVFVWKRLDVHTAIQLAISQETLHAAYRLRYLIENIEAGKELFPQSESLRAWNAHYLKNGEPILYALQSKAVRAPHPITCLNPSEWMSPTSARVDSDARIWIRSEETCWFPLDRCQIKNIQKEGLL